MSQENTPQVAETTSPKAYKEQPVIEKPVSTEQTSGSQEKDLELPDYGALVQESKKYRNRAQEAESQLAKMQKKAEADRQKQMEEQNQWKELAEERAVKIAELEPLVEKFNAAESQYREELLGDFSVEDRETFGNLPLEQLRVLHGKLINKSNVVSTDGSPARTSNVENKKFTDMTKGERQANWDTIVRGYVDRMKSRTN
tara:strand:+ start:1189 stop:1788 length:600 start_codon:yes stop_codon:yes gene_type:complete